MPFTWILGLLIFALFTTKPKRRRNTLVTVLVLLLLFNNNYLANKAMSWWEPAPVLFSDVPKYDVGIVLTGVAVQREPYDRVFFQKGADRVTHTLQLYKAGYIRKILITGGRPGIVLYGKAEAVLLKEFFLMADVPESDLIIEDKARNTYENAQNSAAILKNLPDLKRYVLITSAFHMPRSIRCFTKAGVVFDTFPVDYYGRETVWEDFLPVVDLKAFQLWSILIHEWIGLAAYKLAGKI